jgi:hypothetical protein
MKPYLVTATDRAGRRDTFAHEAASIEHARMRLERDGYRDIEFVDDELTSRLRAEREPVLQPATPSEARFEARLMRRGHDRKLIWLEALRRSRWVLVVAAALLGWGAWHDFSAAFWCGLAVVALVVVPMALAGKSGAHYDALVKACAIGDNEQALALIGQMQGMPVVQGNASLRIDLVFRKAVVLGRNGRLDEALELVAPLRADEHLRDGMFESRSSSIYYAAGRIADFVEWQRRSHEASGHSALQSLDFAFVQARYGDVVHARQLLATLDPANMNAIHKAILLASQGVCALRERDSAQAATLLGRAVEAFKPFAASAPTWPFQGIVAGYAALAMARNGEPDVARNLLAPWRQVAFNCLDASTRRMVEAEVGA